MNFILARHGYPMVVVRSRKKQDYLEALHKADLNVGLAPFDGSHATLEEISPFYKYFMKLIIDEITTDIKFVTIKDKMLWWFDGEPIVFKSENGSKILRMLWDEPKITEAQIISSLGINRSAIQKQLNNLQKKGYILKANNTWYVSITPSM